MGLLGEAGKHFGPVRLIEFVRKGRMGVKLMVVLIPAVVTLLAVTGYVTYMFSSRFLDNALERSVQLQTLGLARELSMFLEQSRQDLLLIADQPPDEARLSEQLERMDRVRPDCYLELSYVPLDGDGSAIQLLLADGKAQSLRTLGSGGRMSDPLARARAAAVLPPLTAGIEPIGLVEIRPKPDGPLIRQEVIRFAAPYRKGRGVPKGVYLLSVKAKRMRDLLSLYNSEKSPIWAFPRSPEIRYSYLFDTDGWMLFQSEDPKRVDQELTTYLARAGYTGTLGKPGQPMAFRPDASYTGFWTMHSQALKQQHGVVSQPDTSAHAPGFARAFFMGFAPVLYEPGPSSEPVVYAGLANIDKSTLNLRAGYKHIDVMFIITLATILLLSFMVYFLGRTITRPIIRLATEVQNIMSSGEPTEIEMPDYDEETSYLKNALNEMIRTMRRQMAAIRERDAAIEGVQARQPATLGETLAGLPESEPRELLGVGPLMDALRADVRKAAQVDADVLLVGETGTGKQMVAEAVHRLSKRSSRPIIAINCGALDENLLLDSLFGHVKGAFTEARADRKGAFLEAQGGMLFLDEIQAATPKVQQSLLRAIAMRKIRPLGSDSEMDVDVRILAAANVDLRGMIREGKFREDLYYRLKVVTIHTPPLRSLRESIPMMALNFLHMSEPQAGRSGLVLSKGAVEKLVRHDWPGNVREMKHAMLRAAIMAEGEVIQSEDIRLDEEASPLPAQEDYSWQGYPADDSEEAGLDASSPHHGPEEGSPGEAQPFPYPATEVPMGDLNPRQQAGMRALARRDSLTRAEYQELQEEAISPRTALNDLSDLVARGILSKLGAGPSTRYVITCCRIPGDYSPGK